MCTRSKKEEKQEKEASKRQKRGGGAGEGRKRRKSATMSLDDWFGGIGPNLYYVSTTHARCYDARRPRSGVPPSSSYYSSRWLHLHQQAVSEDKGRVSGVDPVVRTIVGGDTGILPAVLQELNDAEKALKASAELDAKKINERLRSLEEYSARQIQQLKNPPPPMDPDIIAFKQPPTAAKIMTVYRGPEGAAEYAPRLNREGIGPPGWEIERYVVKKETEKNPYAIVYNQDTEALSITPAGPSGHFRGEWSDPSVLAWLTPYPRYQRTYKNTENGHTVQAPPGYLVMEGRGSAGVLEKTAEKREVLAIPTGRREEEEPPQLEYYKPGTDLSITLPAGFDFAFRPRGGWSKRIVGAPAERETAVPPFLREEEASVGGTFGTRSTRGYNRGYYGGFDYRRPSHAPAKKSFYYR